MNDVQAREFEILKSCIDICNRHSLRYYLVCGSALGAVKYGGFIPWDDDIDVGLPRGDYERFLEIASRELPKEYFIQNYRTDPYFHLLGTKIRDSETTYVEFMCDTLPIHHGVFIDVFPLDGRPRDAGKISEFNKARKKFDAARRVHLNYRRFSRDSLSMPRAVMYHLANRIFGVYEDTSVFVRKFDELVASYPLEDSDFICNYANSASESEFAPKEYYADGKKAVFEGLEVRVPEMADEYLTQKYGDWRAELPSEEQKGHHYYVIKDLDRSYKEYIGKLPCNKKIIKQEK